MKNLLVGAISDKLFNQIVEAADKGGLYLLIDSYGGDLRAGYKIYDFLKGKEDVYVNVVGNCMSAAILVLLGVKKENRSANEHAQFLIHRPLLQYNGQLTQKVAKSVDAKIEEETQLLMKVYRKELQASDASLFAMLDNEQVFGARQAQAMGFIGSVNSTDEMVDEACEKEIMYNKQILDNQMEANELKNAFIDAFKSIFAGEAFQNAKTVATADGKEIKVETSDDIKKGCKVNCNDGSYTLADNRTIVVKNGAIEAIEEPKKEEKPEKEDEEKKQLQEKVKNLEEQTASLQNELDAAKAEIAAFAEQKKKFETLNNLVEEAGGIDAIFNTQSQQPSLQNEGDGLVDNCGYDHIKNLG